MSLSDIDARIYARLLTLQVAGATPVVTASTPFLRVARTVGPVDEEHVREVCAGFPACLLRFDGSLDTRVVDVVSGDSEEREAVTWSVLVVVEDARSIDDGMVGVAGAPGILLCVDAVMQAVNGLYFEDSYRGRRLRHAGTRPELIKRGSFYAYTLLFEALRSAPQTSDPDAPNGPDSPDLGPIVVEENIEGSVDPAPNPFITFEVLT